MIFRFTSKAKDQINIAKLEKIESNKDKVFFEEWNVDIIFIKHKKYFMFTEGKTLFTIIRHAVGVKSINDFNTFIRDIFIEVLNDLVEGINLSDINISNSLFTTTENNNVRRAQIDHLFHAKRLVELGKNTFDVNRIPIASIGYKFPVDYFIEELGKILQNDGFVFIEDVLRN